MLRTSIVSIDIPILASATLKVINTNINILLKFNLIFKIFKIKKITNINISKIINKIIVWNHIEQKIKEYIIICKNTNRFKEDIKSKENII